MDRPASGLRPGGTFGVIWLSRDTRVDWVAEFNSLTRAAREADAAPDGPQPDRRRRREIRFPPGTPMSPVREQTVEYSLPMTKDDLFGLLGTYSAVITLDPDRRAECAQRARDFLGRQPWGQIDLPMICRCLRSTRLPG
jgi:hypothetical protein